MPWTAGAVGLGRMAVLSAMGEPFRAEIELLSYQDEWATPTPRLSSPDRYPLTGFRYNPALDGARLTIRNHPNGRHTVEVAAVRPLNEPFVFLQVELESNAARIVRGYTALVNPHGYGQPPGRPAMAFMPVIVPGAAYANGTEPASAPATPRVNRAPAPVPAGAAVVRNDSVERRQLDAKVEANAKTLVGLLDRVTALELAVQQLQRWQEMQEAAAAAQKPAAAVPSVLVAASAPVPAAGPHPAVVAQPLQATPGASAAQDELPPRHERSWTEIILNEALLVFAGSVLILVIGLIYWIWGRPPLKE